MRKLIFIALLFFLLPISALARSGCCSWHGGVNYCDTSTGRQVCNDGTYSPTCGCRYIPPAPPPPPPIPSVANIRKEINAVQLKYFKNPAGFRERLIKQICDFLGAGEQEVATQVYTMLPDVK